MVSVPAPKSKPFSLPFREGLAEFYRGGPGAPDAEVQHLHKHRKPHREIDIPPGHVKAKPEKTKIYYGFDISV